jgi:hypothetical protein
LQVPDYTPLKMKIIQKVFAIAITFLCTILNTNAQMAFQNDSAYYETFPNKINVRLYVSQKYVHLNFPGGQGLKELEYKANPKMNLGIGFTTRSFSLNLFNGFAFFNKEKEPRGKTKGLDIQLHLYPKKWTVDILAETPRGFHIEPAGQAGAAANTYYYREDVKTSLYSLAAYRIPNKERFSYRAALLQTEWQKKSAGSFLYGGNIYRGKMEGDSALVPHAIDGGNPLAGMTKMDVFGFGPGAGYAHTFIVKQHFFFTGSIIANINVNFVKEFATTQTKKVSLNPSEIFKAAIGYNSRTWNISANWAGNGQWVRSSVSPNSYFFPSGNVRIVVAHKFEKHKHHHHS